MWAFLLAIIAINIILLWQCKKRCSDGKFLLIIWLVAFGLRLAAMIFFNYYVYHGAYEHPDSTYWDQTAIDNIADINTGQLQSLLRPNYATLLVILYSLFGQNMIIPSLFNITLSSWTVILLYILARNIFSQQAGRLTAILATIHPGMIYWSTQNLKEAFVILLLIAAFAVFIPKEKSYQFSGLAWALILSILLFWTRARMVVLLIFALFCGSLILPSRKKTSSIFFSTLFLLWFAVFSLTSVQDKLEKINLPQDSITQPLFVLDFIANRSSTIKGHISFFDDNLPPLDISSASKIIAALPTGLTRFFLFPYPWHARNLNELAFGTYITWWYILIPFIIYGVWLSLKEMNKKAWIPLIFVAQLAMLLGLVLNATGPLVRWREASFALLLIFAGAGIWKLIEHHRKAALLYRALK